MKDLLTILDRNHVLEGFTYQNFDENYFKILKYLNTNQINYINSLKKIEVQDAFKFTENEFPLIPKKLYTNSDLEYFDGYEIIDNEISKFIQKKFNNITMTFVTFATINDKFFLVFKHNGEKYQIGSLNSRNIITFEYLIDIISINIEPYNGSYKDYIFNLIIKKGTKIFSQGNSFSFIEADNEICFCSKNDSFPLKIAPIYISENDNFNRKKSIILDLDSDSDDNSSYSSFGNLPSNKKMNFLFETQDNKKVVISMEYDKNINELRKLYFKKLNRPDLLDDESIYFCMEESVLLTNQKV